MIRRYRYEFRLFPKIPLIRLKTSEKARAHQKLSTPNPGIKYAAMRITPALITSKNKPSVINVIGNVRIIIIGFRVKLIKIITAAKMNPVVQVSILAPFNK